MNKNTAAAKPSASIRVITGQNTRFSYCNLWELRSINGGDLKYSLSAIIPKSDKDTVARIKAAIEAAYHEGGKRN